ncbi:hypothetical protein ACFOZ5_17630 [Marinobacter lacisalsi]|uniref:Uncharacterized protein n=1 Tax=Marinobacter lacisalsi TaxID=475979 RepID=A0ABV8QM91_9GAMM
MGRAGKRSDPQGPPVEYQPFPRGTVHFIAAVILMAVATGALLSILMTWLSHFLGGDIDASVGAAILVVLILVLVTATFLLTRGRTGAHRFLLVMNIFYVGVLAVAAIVGGLASDTSVVATGIVGTTLAVAARFFYRSRRYSECIEYFRVIWTWHRANQHSQQ